MEARHTTNMKKGWICRTSCDEKNHEIAPVMIQIQWWHPVMIQIEWWSISSSDDPYQEMIQIQSSDVDPDREMIQIQWWCSMMIEIEWWSRSSDDVPWWSRSRDDPDPVKMTWRWRWFEDSEDSRCRWSSWYKEEYQCWKLCRKNTFLVKRECWCICNFGMYSSMYLMYCNPMFILGCIYYLFESCCHTPMFRSRG